MWISAVYWAGIVDSQSSNDCESLRETSKASTVSTSLESTKKYILLYWFIYEKSFQEIFKICIQIAFIHLM